MEIKTPNRIVDWKSLPDDNINYPLGAFFSKAMFVVAAALITAGLFFGSYVLTIGGVVFALIALVSYPDKCECGSRHLVSKIINPKTSQEKEYDSYYGVEFTHTYREGISCLVCTGCGNVKRTEHVKQRIETTPQIDATPL